MNHRLGEDHAFQNDGRGRVAQRLARGDFFQADAGGDVARQHFLDFGAVVGVHLKDAANAFALALDGVQHRLAGSEHAGIDAHEGELADEGVGHQFEGQRSEFFVVIRLAGDFVAVIIQRLELPIAVHLLRIGIVGNGIVDALPLAFCIDVF